MKRLIFPISLIVVFIAILVYALFFHDNSFFKIEDRSSQVDVFIGTDFHGHTFPGAILPFGMVQLSPDTRLNGWDGCSAYHYSDSIIYGFSHTHLSGTGCSDYGDILLLPLNNFNPKPENYQYSDVFSHSNEKASPGYYSVKLENSGILVELTATERVGFHKYTYPDAKERYVLLDLAHRDEVIETYIKQVSETRIVGLRRSKAWANDQILYFVADFSESVYIADYNSDLKYLVGSEILSADDIENYGEGEKLPRVYTGKNNKIILKPVSKNSNELLVKVGLSAVSEEGAIKNLEAEIPDWDFENIKIQAKKTWDSELSKILVYGGSEDDQKTFYTALYHCFVAPNVYSDVDGSFRGTDLNVHKSEEHDTYTVFSLWDTYRATHPLFTIIQQKRTLDFIKTFLDQYKYDGRLPVWELSANETGCMIGYHSVPVIADAYLKGINDFDIRLAMEAMVSEAVREELGKVEFAEYGYIPMDKEHESVSKTLEYAFDDWCIAQFAAATDNEKYYTQFIERSQFYKNIFNASTGFMQPKMNGAWFEPFNPKEVNFNFTEANSWQYSFYVPQDILTLIEMHGGEEKFASKLDELFNEDSETSGTQQVDITGLIGQYAHGNEPSHHIAYLYNYCGQAWKTQQMVRKIMKELYTSAPDGLCGNEDCGQMSAWYVFSALGFYPVNPANGIYDIGSPLFDTVIIQLENGKNFTIIAHNNSPENIYIQRLKLDGIAYNKTYITHKSIISGGKLEYFMGPEPNKNWGIDEKSIYDSRIVDNLISTVPVTNLSKKSFYKSFNLELLSAEKSAEIFYTLNTDIEKEAVKYTKPILINSEVKIEAYAVSEGKKRSKIMTAEYNMIPDDRSIEIISQYSPQYSAGGDNALIDFVKGDEWFRSGFWQGYKGQDFEAIVDLKEIKNIKLINVRFLQDIKSWIFFPKRVTMYISKDGHKFGKIYESFSKMPDNDYEIKIQEFTNQPENLKARYIKVVAESYGKLPEWHLSPGYDSWIFIDEIEIK
ncbi:MAG TPA: GH92 family glycosyl hydrolase [Bacteroidales bacterium]|nr:GH92 family glycosyl hydrolase [Bacteroidales bacterium]